MPNAERNDFGSNSRTINGERKVAQLRYLAQEPVGWTQESRYDFPVERGIAIPAAQHERPRFPFAGMKPGDSFVVDSRLLLNRARQEARRRRMRIKTGKVKEDMFRVWLVARASSAKPVVATQVPPPPLF